MTAPDPSYDRDRIAWIAMNTRRGYKSFVTKGRYTWPEAIRRCVPTVYDDEIPLIEAEIHRQLVAIAHNREWRPQVVLDPDQPTRAAEPLPSCGRRVIRKGTPFS